MRESRYNVWAERDDAAYVFNGMSGALLRIPAAEYRGYRGLMDGDDGGACPPETLAHLVAGSMLVADDADELAELRDRYTASRFDAGHFALTVVTSLGCNFDCPYCFENRSPSVMDERVQALVLEVLDVQLPRIRSFSVTWFGGEPLVGMAPLRSLSDAFIARCDAAGVHYDASVVTNGYLLDEACCRELAARRVTGVQVGLDGPPDVHDVMRPLASGRPSFDRILANLRHAVDHLDVSVRVNVDRNNIGRVEELFHLLAAAGLSGRLRVYPGQLVGITSNPLAPSATYAGCMTHPEFARAEREFLALAERYGLAEPGLPRPLGAPCTAVRANELVVGSRGELYKCWDSVSDRNEVIGHIQDATHPNGRLGKWLAYDPFADAECRSCIALPVCMGGCAHHAFSPLQYENRCGTFRHTYREQVSRFVDHAEKRKASRPVPVALMTHRPSC
ncbi:MAG: radical SAM protein [Kineosporiaceae bacterium]